MSGWKKSINKDYHFITVQESTEKKYGFQFLVACTGEMRVYMLMKSTSQTKGCYLDISSLNLSASYWAKACAAVELSTIAIDVAAYSKNNVTAKTEAIAAAIEITVLGDKAEVISTVTEAVHARAGAARINSHAMQATV